MTDRSRALIWAATVGIVLADSSVVTLALPAILARFDTSVFEVSWVLTSFNIVLALLVLPAARLASGAGAARAAPVWAIGMAVFAAGSLACALAPSVAFLIAGRCVQAVGGAAVIAGAIELLARSRGSHARAAGAWGAAGLAGLALGPAAGGLLTELISWQSIFAVQVPLVGLIVLAGRAPAGAPERGRSRAAEPRPRDRARPAVGRADRRAVPARHPADRGVGGVAAGGGAHRLGDAGRHAAHARGDPAARARARR